MPRAVQREAQSLSKQEFYAHVEDLPGRVEFVRGVIGPYSDTAKLVLLANWGVDDIIRLTGPEVWQEALAARSSKTEA
jgi:hypothetical protein